MRLIALALLVGCGSENGLNVRTDPDTGTDSPCEPVRWYADADADGWGRAEVVEEACERPDGFVEDATDCDDGDPAVHPGAEDPCDGLDDDCDGQIDEDAEVLTWYTDADGDGFGDSATEASGCDRPEGTALVGDDCDDHEPEAYPGYEEVCDGIDNDCDGTVDGDFCVCGGDADTGLAVTIVESRSMHDAHDMDLRWEEVVSAMGNTPSLADQDHLDDIANLADADLLIVASGTITLTGRQVDTLLAFLESGGSVYLQTEYNCTFTTNLAFASLAADLGGSFAWTGTVNGDLGPVSVEGCLAEHPLEVTSLPYHWYGCAGGGVPAILTKGTSDIGFHFCPADPAQGALLTSTDQDWVRERAYTEADALMENILAALATHPASCP